MRWKLGLAMAAITGLIVVSNVAKQNSVPEISELGKRGVVTKNIPLSVRTSLPAVPSTQRLYRLVQNKRSLVEVEKTARDLGMSGKANEIDGRFMVRDGSNSLTDYGSGFWYLDEQNFAQAQKRPGLQDANSSGAAANRIAARFLPPGVSIVSVEHHEGKATITDANGKEDIFPIGHEFRYRLSVSGVPVVGPGAQLRVYIGANNELDAMFFAAPSLRPEKELRIITPAAAIDRLQRRGVTASQLADSAEVTEFDLAYYVPPIISTLDEQETLIQPVYVMKVQVSHGDSVETVTEYVQAAEQVD
ncbi:MAG TPA: hypothetical protein VK191_03950 [Symbiobacteriaceae bacterium]|nr:hypothetical protein [Symbiobacteriaceae bacterium]